MFIQGVKSGGSFIESHEKLVPAITKERTIEIVNQLKEFHKQEEPLLDVAIKYKMLQDELIEGHLRIGTFLASRYKTIFPKLGDDLQSESFLAICQAVSRIHGIKHTYPTRYIIKYIHGAIFNYINRQTKIMYIPKDKISEMLKKRESFIQYQETVDVNDEEIEDQRKSEEHLIDTFERIVKKANLTSLEHQIILFHLTNQTDEEIGHTLGKSRANVQLIKQSAINKVRFAYNSDLIGK